MKKNSVLIVGSSSKIAKNIISSLDSNSIIYGISRKKLTLKSHNNYRHLKFDLSNFSENNEHIITLKKERFNCIIFAQGLLNAKELKSYAVDDIYKVFDINIISTIKLCKILIPLMLINSKVIFLSSISANNGSYDEVYASSKSALKGLCVSLAKKYGNKTTFNIISPGTVIDSKMTKKINANTLIKHKMDTPTGKLNNSKDIAKIILSILDQSWNNLNGETIEINGGRYFK